MAKYSKKAQEFISKKMETMKEEDIPHKQKVAIALSYARKKGYKIPVVKDKSKKGSPDIHCSDHEHLANPTRRGKYQSKTWKP